MTETDKPCIQWIRLPDAVKLLWVDNPKLHDIDLLIQSVKKYGFQELPKLDINLINRAGKRGAIKSGNGRIEALSKLREAGAAAPRGIAIDDKDGEWVIPILTGTDGQSEQEALAYAIDANNLTVAGSGFTAYDIARMWDERYISQLKGLTDGNELPVSITDDILDTLLLQEATFKRPEFDTVIEKFQSEVKGNAKGDEKWIYIEFYGDDNAWEEVRRLLVGRFIMGSGHEINSQFFLDAIRFYLENGELNGT